MNVRFGIRWAIASAALLWAGCAPWTEIRNSTQLIHADNQLALLIATSSEPGAGSVTGTSEGSAEVQLVLLGEEAMANATRLNERGGVRRKLEAVSWYRVAATAFWQSRSPSAVDSMFQAAQAGQALCIELGERAPDRDSLYLKLVIPFAAFEAGANTSERGLLRDLGEVDFGEETGQSEAKTRLEDAFARLGSMRRALEALRRLETDTILVEHAGLREYYARNMANAEEFFEAARQKLGSRTAQLREMASGDYEALGYSMDDIRRLKLREQQRSPQTRS